MPWWIWILIALACLALEVMTPGGESSCSSSECRLES